MAEGGKEAIRVDEEVVGSSEVKVLEKRIRELERVLGKKTLENEILREAVKRLPPPRRSGAVAAEVLRGGWSSPYFDRTVLS